MAIVGHKFLASQVASRLLDGSSVSKVVERWFEKDKMAPMNHNVAMWQMLHRDVARI